MRTSLLRIAAIASVLDIAAGATLGVVANATQGQAWMTFNLAQWVVLGVAFFTMPVLAVLWIGWAIFRRMAWRWSVMAFGMAAASIPLVYGVLLVVHWMHE